MCAEAGALGPTLSGSPSSRQTNRPVRSSPAMIQWSPLGESSKSRRPIRLVDVTSPSYWLGGTLPAGRSEITPEAGGGVFATRPLDHVGHVVTLRYMASVRIASVEAPLDRPSLVDPAIRLLRRALAMGLLGDTERVDRLDLELVRRIAREASAAGIGQDAAVALLQGASEPSRLAALIERLDDSLSESPLPDRELPELLRVFGREDLAVLTGTSGVSLGRYVAGSRKWPDELATRIHWLALVLSDLAGAYNDVGARRWFERERTQLDGRSPRQVLGTEWDPASPDVERVRQLAASLAGVGAAT